MKAKKTKENLAERLSTIKWHYIHKRNRSLFYMYLLFEGVSHHYNKKINFPYEVRLLALDGDLSVPEKDWLSLKEYIYEHNKKNNDFLIKLLQQSYNVNIDVEAMAKKYNKIDYRDIDTRELVKMWEKYVNLVYIFGSFVLLPLFIEPEMESELKLYISKKYPDDMVGEIFQALTTPIKPGVILREELNLIKLAVKKSKGMDIDKALKDHIYKFAWIKNNSFDGSFFTEEEYMERIDEVIKNGAQKKYRMYTEKIKSEKKKFNKYKKSLQSFPGADQLIDTLQESIFFRSWRTERYYRNAYFLQKFFSTTAKILNIKKEKDLFYLIPEEIISGLENEEKVDFQEIKNRKKSYLLWIGEEKTTIYSGDKSLDAKNKISYVSSSSLTELRGQCTFPGKIIGKARIIFSKDELSKICEGDILITPSTTPNYFPVLKKVKAIVTEEGGVLSHASVISRELHIPCVIGTKVATRVLKDGDEVEVDADKGIVKIIK